MDRIVIIGSGFVGSTSAYTLAIKNLAKEIILIDINQPLAEGETMDINDGSCAFGSTRIRVGTYVDCAESDVIVITAGVGRRPGQSRDELLETNERIIESVLEGIKPHYTGSFVLMVSNPVDELTTYVARKGFIAKNKLCGTGCLLDSFRWRSVLSEYLDVPAQKLTVYAVGKHGAAQQALWDKAAVDGMPIKEFCKDRKIKWDGETRKVLHEKVTELGAEIIARKGKTQFGIAATVAYIIECLEQDGYTLVSVGNLLYSKECTSMLVNIGNHEVISILAENELVK